MPFLPAHTEVIAPGQRPEHTLFLLHGIYGAGRNWRFFANEYVRRRPDWRFVLIDLRNHGGSIDAPPPHDLQACARDLSALSEVLGRPDTIVGHSFGGKVSMLYASEYPSCCDELWVLDSPPGPSTSHGRLLASEAGRVLDEVRKIPVPVAVRTEASRTLMKAGIPRHVALWMATNLRPMKTGGHVWNFDLDAAEEMLDSYWEVDCYPFLQAPPATLAIHFVTGERSDRFGREELRRIEGFHNLGLLRHWSLPDAGHWLHVDNPSGLLDMLTAT